MTVVAVAVVETAVGLVGGAGTEAFSLLFPPAAAFSRIFASMLLGLSLSPKAEFDRWSP